MTLPISRRTLVAAAAAAPLTVAATVQGAPAQPRLFFTPQRLERARSWRQGPLASSWRTLRATADAAHHAGSVAFASHAGSSDQERGWQRDVGNTMATLAAAYLLDGQPADRDLAIGWTLEAANYSVWGADRLDGADLAAGHLLFGTAMVLDWLGPQMDPPTRARIVAALQRRGAQMMAAARGTGVKPAYWASQWMQNHLWVNMAGLLAAGLALRADDPAASAQMTGTATSLMTRAFAALPADGSSQEGPGYWDYGAEYLLKFHHLATELPGASLDEHWLREAASYRAAMALPAASWSPTLSMLNPADAPVAPWTGPEYMLRRLAALNHDGAAQALAARLEAAGAVHAASPWLNFVWYDPAVPATEAAARPSLEQFQDLGLIVARSDRSGHEAVVLMRAGPPLGHRAQAMRYAGDVGVAHTHPDVNHITLFGAGAFLLRDDGYAGIKDTALHNTLLVNGVGQIGAGGQWTKYPTFPLPDPQPSTTVVATQPGFDYWVGQGATAYPASAGLRRFDRHVLFVKPDILVVIDDLEAAGPAAFSLLWHPGAAALAAGEHQYRVALQSAALQMAFVLPEGAHHAPARRGFAAHDAASGAAALDEVAVTIPARAAQCGALFTWGPAGSPPSLARLTRQADSWVLEAAGRRLVLRPGDRRISFA